ncbi:MAG: carboxypeptidase-like regulatory domain-containing protein [Deltaproteobacteria bacterium]|nr:carboxypeptidase-like regulatory domain-containing protein [Deltaproteobacteria bacterium]
MAAASDKDKADIRRQLNLPPDEPIGIDARKFYTKEIRGRVVDADTRKPIEGAVVVAVWEYKKPYGEGSIDVIIDIAESVTDKDGNYFIAAKGPLTIPWNGEFKRSDPELWFFKEGYEAQDQYNMDKAIVEKILSNPEGFDAFVSYEEMRAYYKDAASRLPWAFKRKKYTDVANLDSELLGDEFSRLHDNVKTPKGQIRESVWNGRLITLHPKTDEERYWDMLRYFYESFEEYLHYHDPNKTDFVARDISEWRKVKNALHAVKSATKNHKSKILHYHTPEFIEKELFKEEAP